MRLLLVFLLIAAIVGSSEAQSPKQHAGNKQNNQPEAKHPAAKQDSPDAVKPAETQFYTYNNQKTEGNETVKNISDGFLALFTLALVVVSVMQWTVLRKHEDWMRKHDANLEKLAQSALDNEKATAENAKAANASIQLTHRPKLIIRNVVMQGLAKLNRETPINEMSPVLNGSYVVVNIGGLPATIEHRTEGTWCDKDVLPMERPDKINPGIAVSEPIAPGESKEFIFPQIVLSTEDAVDFINRTATAYFLVQIEYIDAAGIRRRTSACRRFATDIKRFMKVDNLDYEYAD